MFNPRIILGWIALACSLHAADLPKLVLPDTIGVNIHFNRGHERDLELIAAAGFRWVRMDLGWAGIERKKGEYDWSAYDELTANLAKRGLRAIYILDYSNPLYEETVASRNPMTGQDQHDTASPRHPESVAAFARWAGAAAAHFRGRRVVWEIWNEPNISFWKPKPDVAEYNALALATAKAVRQADPQATIIGPATSELPLKFLEAFFACGILEQLDAVSVHPYRSYAKSPETAGEEYRKLRELIDRHSPKKKLPIISGEWGYSSFDKGVSTETQAAFLVRQQLFNLLEDIPISIWYDWKDDGPDQAEREHRFGTVGQNLEPKAAYGALKLMTTELANCRLVRRVPLASPDDYVLVFSAPGKITKLAAWTTGKPHRVTLPAKVKRKCRINGALWAGAPAAVSISRNAGQLTSAEIQSGHEASGASVAVHDEQLELGLPVNPLYVTLDGVALRP